MNHFTKSDNGTYYYLVVNERLFILTPYCDTARWAKYVLMEKIVSQDAFRDIKLQDCYDDFGLFPTIKSAEEYIRNEMGVREEQPVYETLSVHFK